MVRSNPRSEIGFLSNEKRMNVAVTRAKRLCVLIGDSGTVGKNKFLKSLVDYFRANGKGKNRLRKKIKRSSNRRKKISPRRINPSTNHLCWRPQQTRGAKKNFMTSLLNSSTKALKQH